MGERSTTRGARQKKMIGEDVKWLESGNARAKRNAKCRCDAFLYQSSTLSSLFPLQLYFLFPCHEKSSSRLDMVSKRWKGMMK